MNRQSTKVGRREETLWGLATSGWVQLVRSDCDKVGVKFAGHILCQWCGGVLTCGSQRCPTARPVKDCGQ